MILVVVLINITQQLNCLKDKLLFY